MVQKFTSMSLFLRCHKACTGSKPLSRIIQSARWRMLGHMLRLDTSSPVQQAMSAYFQPGSSGFRGRPRTTLPRSINNDLKNSRSTNSLTSHEDLVALRQLAQDRRKWKELMCAVCSGRSYTITLDTLTIISDTISLDTLDTRYSNNFITNYDNNYHIKCCRDLSRIGNMLALAWRSATAIGFYFAILTD